MPRVYLQKSSGISPASTSARKSVTAVVFSEPIPGCGPHSGDSLHRIDRALCERPGHFPFFFTHWRHQNCEVPPSWSALCYGHWDQPKYHLATVVDLSLSLNPFTSIPRVLEIPSNPSSIWSHRAHTLETTSVIQDSRIGCIFSSRSPAVTLRSIRASYVVGSLVRVDTPVFLARENTVYLETNLSLFPKTGTTNALSSLSEGIVPCPEVSGRRGSFCRNQVRRMFTRNSPSPRLPYLLLAFFSDPSPPLRSVTYQTSGNNAL